MMIRSASNGKVGYNQLVEFAQWLMDAITEAMHQASASLVSLGKSIQPFIRASELVEQFKADISAEEEIGSEDLSCDSCYHFLGGGCCRINLEDECREGGGFEAFEPKTIPEPDPERVVSKGEKLLRTGFIVLLMLSYPLVLYKLYQWIAYLIGK